MAEPTMVWKVFCRSGGEAPDYAEAARAGDYVAIGGERTGPLAAFATQDDLRATWHRLYGPDHTRADHLWRFHNDVRVGHWVCMPVRGGPVHIGIFDREGTYWLADGDRDCPFGHRRHVQWLYTAPTRELEAALGGDVTGRQTLNELPRVTPEALVRAAHAVGASAPARRERRYWAVGADPDRYRVEEAVAVRSTDLWMSGDKDIRPGDRLAIWKFAGGSGRRGVVSLGEVLDAPRPRDDRGNPYWTDTDDDGAGVRSRVTVRYVRPPRVPLWLGTEGAGWLGRLAIARARGGTIFEINARDWDTLVTAAGGWPDESPEVEQAIAELESLAGRTRSRGQGFGLSPVARRAVEQRAMHLASQHYIAQGYAVEDVSARESYDLRCERPGVVLHVEVKGTTGAGTSFLITRNEHELARARHPATALVLVRGVVVRTSADGATTADGGAIHVLEPWDPASCSPQAIAFECHFPEA